MPAAVDISSVAGLTALGMFTAQILGGLLLSVGYTLSAVSGFSRSRVQTSNF